MQGMSIEAVRKCEHECSGVSLRQHPWIRPGNHASQQRLGGKATHASMQMWGVQPWMPPWQVCFSSESSGKCMDRPTAMMHAGMLCVPHVLRPGKPASLRESSGKYMDCPTCSHDACRHCVPHVLFMRGDSCSIHACLRTDFICTWMHMLRSGIVFHPLAP